MPTPFIVLNESSTEALPVLDQEPLLANLGEFADVIREVRRTRRDMALVSEAPVQSLPARPDGRPLAAVMESHGGLLREKLRVIRQMQNRSPIGAVESLRLVDQGEEYRMVDVSVTGLGVAHVNRILGVSFRGEAWDAAVLQLSRLWLVEDAAGDITELEEEVHVQHASRVEHVVEHRRFIRESVIPDPPSGRGLWDDRVSRYPNLRLLPRVEGQLVGLGSSEAVRQVAGRLAQLQEAIEAWDRDRDTNPAWRSHVTPESPSRRRLCVFQDVDGENHLFELHARYTPGAGRIHFRIEFIDWAAELAIAHIGQKL